MRRIEGAKPDINVTPLVDVVLVLLIIFMVVIPQMEAGATVTLKGVSLVVEKAPLKGLEVNVEKLAMGDALHVRELVLAAGVRALIDGVSLQVGDKGKGPSAEGAS